MIVGFVPAKITGTRWMLVQFHPSTSYEDFFEGYRPEVDAKGQLSYRLTEGPLALLAGRANDAPTLDYLMVVDEINRANLPEGLIGSSRG